MCLRRAATWGSRGVPCHRPRSACRPRSRRVQGERGSSRAARTRVCPARTAGCRPARASARARPSSDARRDMRRRATRLPARTQVARGLDDLGSNPIVIEARAVRVCVGMEADVVAVGDPPRERFLGEVGAVLVEILAQRRHVARRPQRVHELLLAPHVPSHRGAQELARVADAGGSHALHQAVVRGDVDLLRTQRLDGAELVAPHEALVVEHRGHHERRRLDAMRVQDLQRTGSDEVEAVVEGHGQQLARLVAVHVVLQHVRERRELEVPPEHREVLVELVRGERGPERHEVVSRRADVVGEDDLRPALEGSSGQRRDGSGERQGSGGAAQDGPHRIPAERTRSWPRTRSAT